MAMSLIPGNLLDPCRSLELTVHVIFSAQRHVIGTTTVNVELSAVVSGEGHIKAT